MKKKGRRLKSRKPWGDVTAWGRVTRRWPSSRGHSLCSGDGNGRGTGRLSRTTWRALQWSLTTGHSTCLEWESCLVALVLLAGALLQPSLLTKFKTPSSNQGRSCIMLDKVSHFRYQGCTGSSCNKKNPLPLHLHVAKHSNGIIQGEFNTRHWRMQTTTVHNQEYMVGAVYGRVTGPRDMVFVHVYRTPELCFGVELSLQSHLVCNVLK